MFICLFSQANPENATSTLLDPAKLELLTVLIKILITLIFALIGWGINKLTRAIANKFNINTELTQLQEVDDFIRRVVLSCVQATNQTFVDGLKKSNKFTSENQKKAFEITYNAVYSVVSDFLGSVVDVDNEESVKNYLTKIIEETVKMCKDDSSNAPVPINIETLDVPSDVEELYSTLEETFPSDATLDSINEEDITD